MFGNKTGSKTAEEMYIKAIHNQLGTLKDGGEGGIRTHDGRLTHTPLAGERLQPLGHLSIF